MAHPIYNVESLGKLSFAQIKKIGRELGVHVVDKRVKDCWVHAIVSHQQAQVKKVENAENDMMAELAEAACEELGLRIYDLELEYGDVVLPVGAIIYVVRDCFGHHEGNIFKESRGRYRTWKGVYENHWQAALSLVSDFDCVWAMSEAVAAREERDCLPEYF